MSGEDYLRAIGKKQPRLAIQNPVLGPDHFPAHPIQVYCEAVLFCGKMHQLLLIYTPEQSSMRILYSTALLSWAAFSFASITLEAPAEAPAGATITIGWTGESNPLDFITIVTPDTPEGTYDAYGYAKKGQWQAEVPETPGDYEIRYLSAEHPYPTLATKPLTVTPVTATITVPPQASAGATISVTWEGPDNARDFITIVSADAPEKAYETYQYTKKGSPLTLRAPDAPGTYEVRYLTGKGYLTLAAAEVEVTSVTASLDVPDSVGAGAAISVTWEGPDNRGDYITIVPAGAPPKRYDAYVYTNKGSPLELRAPDDAGPYEIRYLSGQSDTTLAARPIRVTATDASLEAPSNAMAGSSIEVTWQGPGNRGDYLTIVAAGADGGTYGDYRYIDRGNPLELIVPEAAGDYEIRYLTGQKDKTLASSRLTVEPVSAELTAPDSVKGGTAFEITWDGPDNTGDVIVLVSTDDPVSATAKSVYTRHGNPAVMDAPLVAGRYALRYLTGRRGRVLAERAIEITPPDLAPGFLQVTASRDRLSPDSGDAVEVILDASGSMLQRIDGRRRIDIAKQVLIALTGETIPAGMPFVLRVFGHREADSCRTDLEVPLAPLSPASLAETIKGINAENLAKTPIARSLELVAGDLAGVTGRRMVILITDGEETCGGDPLQAIAALERAGISIRLNIVGFAIDDPELEDAFANWADLGNGHYLSARNAEQLEAALVGALNQPFRLIDANGRLVRRDLTGGEPIELAPGRYQVIGEASGGPPVAVEIRSGETAVVQLE